MIKRTFTLTLILILCFSGIHSETFSYAQANSSSSDVPVPSAPEPDADSEYREGTVLVTVAAPEDTVLTREGTSSFDSHISIENAYNFGDADILAKNKEQQDFLSDKTLYVSEVCSDSYSTNELMNTLDEKAYVIGVEPDYEQYLTSASNDTYTSEQWHLDNDGTFSGTSSGISYSYAKSRPKSAESVIAVMDTGIDYTHEDLAGHIWTNTNPALPGIHGYDFTTGTPDCMDTNGHGTHCAGTIAAVSDNQKGISGISDAKLMALKIFDSNGKTSNSAVLKAMNYIFQAQSLGINITAVNCSWGGGSSGSLIPSLISQIGQNGTLFVFAAGNDGINHNTSFELDCPYDLYRGVYADNRNYIIITGSSDVNDSPSSFSDYGSLDVDLFAPGENILSTSGEELYFPGIYESGTENMLTSRLLSFNNSDETGLLFTDRELEVPSNVTATITSAPWKDYRSRSDSGSLMWTIDLGVPKFADKSTYLYLDITDMELEPENTYYVSMLFGSTDSDGHFTWEHIVKKSSGELNDSENRFYIAPNGKMYFKVIGLETSGLASGTYDYYIDDIGLSTADPDTSLFGRYDIASGTSMAAPMVTGAVALLNEIYPNDNAANRRGRLLACTRQTSGTAGKCITGGVLDLKNMDAYTAPPQSQNSDNKKTDSSQKTKNNGKKIKKIKIKTSKKSVKAGKRLKLKAVITPSNATNKKIKWRSSKKKWASVSQKGVMKAKKKGIGHTVTITATATDGSRKKASVKIRIKK